MSQVPPNRNNFCYRHPDRQSFVLCQRCTRTICPDCQTQAPVGVVCPECMREQRASMPRRKPAILRRSSERPVVTLGIIVVTAFVFVLQLVPFFNVTSALAYAPFTSYPGLGLFEPWRMLTAALVHSTGFGFILHVGLNMYTLWIFGQVLEPMLGRWRFLSLYLICAFGGSVGVLLLAPIDQSVVGASGAIFGLMGAFMVIQRRLGGNMTSLLVLVGINLVIGFIPGANIAWQAHVGGLVTGALLGLVFMQTRAERRQGLQKLLIGGVAVLLVVVTAAKVLV